MKDKSKLIENINIRSEEVQEIMGDVPSWITRWGITIIFLIVISLFIGSFIFKYPDVIVTEMKLTSTNPVAHLIARTSGRLSTLFINDADDIKADTVLGIIENSASLQDIERLERLITIRERSPDTILLHIQNLGELRLGDIQPDYTSFIRALNAYKNYKQLEYYPKKIVSAKNQLFRYNNFYQIQSEQHSVIELQHSVAKNQYARDSLLLSRGVISQSDYETAYMEYLQSRSSLENSLGTLENLQIQIEQLRDNILDLELQQMEQDAVIFQDYTSAIETLQNSINTWRLNYCLISPIEGCVTFTKYWNENQFVTAGEIIFTVVPRKEDQLIGISLLPLSRSGKVKPGQRVIIRLVNYPDQEFGIIRGIVTNISLVPNDDYYRVEVILPDGLKTNYGNVLPMNQEMTATAEIVTEELRLIERFVQPIRRLFKESL
ncbi:MAG: HlyD family secretion protein [Tannerellaceae bacterium]|nr:HlyD family secretion protein [Tannerellaceae bacterium]